MSNTYVSYKDFIDNYQNFKKVDRNGFNRFDNPTFLYWRPFFYFNEGNGLLGIDDMSFNNSETDFEKEVKELKATFDKNYLKTCQDNTEQSVKEYSYIRNTAYHYLMLNDELERAEMLKKFVMLLSNISQNSPWYFTELTGLDAALERKQFEEFKIEEARKSIQIKCLSDAADDRIGTLLDLYRAICYSYQMKKEVVPENLRKFNMGIMIFPAPIRGKSGKNGDKNAKTMIPVDGETYDFFVPSCKLIELRNCEFDYNSSKTPYGTLKSDEPFMPEYTITISFNDAYESRYNEIMQYVITDLINTDIKKRTFSGENSDAYVQWSNIHTRTIEDTDRFRLKSEDVDVSYRKSQFVDADFERNPYAIAANLSYSEESREANDIGSKGPIETMKTNAKKKIEEAGEVLGMKDRENIHDNGTVSNYGLYEYLNRISGTNSVLGKLATTVGGVALNAVKSTLIPLALGNIYSASLTSSVANVSKLLNGDFSGVVSSTKEDVSKTKIYVESKESGNSAKSSPDLKNKKLSGYPTSLQIKTATNIARSVRNNL